MLRLVPYYGNTLDKSYSDMSDMIDNFFKAPFSDGVYDSFKVDVKKEEDKYVVTADLPGVSKANLDVNVEDGVLTIAVEQKEEKEEKDDKGNYLHRERRMVNSSRRISLGDVDEDAIDAELKDGVLTVNLPIKAEVSNKKSISIR